MWLSPYPASQQQDLNVDRTWRYFTSKALIPRHFSSEESYTLIIKKKEGHSCLLLTWPFLPQIQHAEAWGTLTETMRGSKPQALQPGRRRPSNSTGNTKALALALALAALLDPTDCSDWRHGDFKKNRMQYKGILIPHPTKVTVLKK